MSPEVPALLAMAALGAGEGAPDPDLVRMRHPLTPEERDAKRAHRARRKAERNRKRDQRRKARR